MTFEELKAEADKQGYNLVKKYQPMPKLKICPICGRIPKVRYSNSTIYVSCPSHKCLDGPVVNRRAEDGVRLIISKSDAERQAREAWNEMISKGEKE
jgi:hypothetical protein